MTSFFRVGVDVGGTNTDAVVVDVTASDSPGRGVLASHKTPTTTDITSGIEAAIAEVLKFSAVAKERVLSVNIGTTHFINALIEADNRRLDRVAVIRLCGPFTRQLPPFSDVPEGLRSVLDGGSYFLDGGLEIDGRVIADLDGDQIISTAKRIAAAGVRAVAVVGVFSPVSSEQNHEEMCKKLIGEHVPQLKVVCSHSIGPIGLLERENATILNAAILNTAARVTRGFKAAMRRLSLHCPLYLSQNDGTLIDVDIAAQYPIKTFASGPTNSMIGAAFLAGLDKVYSSASKQVEIPVKDFQILVVDIGGTTTDVCALLPSGFPRPAPGFVEIGGVRTAFSIPEVASIGLGGGSVVKSTSPNESHCATVTVGPASVGHTIQTEALVFGGQTLTTTDVVVAAGKLTLGNASLTSNIPSTVIQAAQAEIKRKLEAIVDKMKVSRAPVHVLLVGGGAVLAPNVLQGVEKCTLPPHAGAANAVGAAIAKVCGEVDVVEMIDGKSEDDVVSEARRNAIDMAVEKGASYDDVEVVEVNKMPLQYTHKPAMRIQVRAVGRLASFDQLTPPASPPRHLKLDDDVLEEEPKVLTAVRLSPMSSTKPVTNVSLSDYRPDVRSSVWYVSDVDLGLIATGCGVLGTGGGGPTHYELLKSLTCLRSCGRGEMRVISPSYLKDADLVCSGAWYGSPSVLNERIGAGTEIPLAMDAMKRLLGNETSFQAFLAPEIGGGNGVCSFHIATTMGVPVVDGDSMGRAYPTIGHTTFNVYEYSPAPCVLADARSNVVAVMGIENPQRLEGVMRKTAVELGLACGVSAAPRTGAEIKSHAVPHTMSLAWYIGRAIHLARQRKTNYFEAIFDVCPGKLLFTGKIVDVRRFVGAGYTMGFVIVRASSEDGEVADADTGLHMYVPFQNEYLYAATSDAEGSEPSRKVVCTVPDLISILGQDGEAVGSQDLRYGLNVNVIAMPAHPLWKTERALKVGGPEGFGLTDMPVVYGGGDGGFGLGRSVIEEFGTTT